VSGLFNREKQAKEKLVKKNKEKKVKRGLFSRKEHVDNSVQDVVVSAESEEQFKSIFQTRDLKDVFSFKGLNSAPFDHIEFQDGAETVYARTFYVQELPRGANFGMTFSEILNFPNTYSSVKLEPIPDKDATKSLDRDLTSVESEIISASRQGDTNRIRRLRSKYNEGESIVSEIESKQNKFYSFQIITTIYNTDFDALNNATRDLFKAGERNGVTLTSFYGRQLEGFLLNNPYNLKIKQGVIDEFRYKIPYHRVDIRSLSTIFNHIRGDFCHKKGVLIGEHMISNTPVIFDVFDPGHRGYNLTIVGQTRSGKSSFIKKMIKLCAVFYDYKFVALDTQRFGSRGEYADVCESVGGVNVVLGPQSPNRVNFFDISTETIYKKETQEEVERLSLADAVSNIYNVVAALIVGKRTSYELSEVIENVTRNAILSLYLDRGIVDGDVSSLYERSEYISAGRHRKTMPTMSDLYVKLVQQNVEETSQYKMQEYEKLLARVSDYVREVYICHGCGKTYTQQEYEGREVCSCNSKIQAIRGTVLYFDGETSSTVQRLMEDRDVPMLNFDVSGVPDADLELVMMVTSYYIESQFLKRNSLNPLKAQKLVYLSDELHKSFVNKYVRKIIINAYRTAGKANASCWTATQSIKDYFLYKDAKAEENPVTIVTQSTAMFLFNHKQADVEYLQQLDNLNENDIQFIIDAAQGECLLVDTTGKARVRIILLDSELDFANTNVELEKERSRRKA
jgi:hypothetical protein